MPHSQYLPGREPPSFADRILNHPFLTSLSGGTLVTSGLLVGSVLAGAPVSRALEGLPTWVLLILALALSVSSVTALRGTIFPSPRWSKLDNLKMERSGCIALALAWLAYAVTVALSGNPYGIVTVVSVVALSGGFGLRAAALHVSEKRVRRRMSTEQNNGG